jgi:glutamine synthetase adenylyltransferase
MESMLKNVLALTSNTIQSTEDKLKIAVRPSAIEKECVPYALLLNDVESKIVTWSGEFSELRKDFFAILQCEQFMSDVFQNLPGFDAYFVSAMTTPVKSKEKEKEKEQEKEEEKENEEEEEVPKSYMDGYEIAKRLIAWKQHWENFPEKYKFSSSTATAMELLGEVLNQYAGEWLNEAIKPLNALLDKVEILLAANEEMELNDKLMDKLSSYSHHLNPDYWNFLHFVCFILLLLLLF